MVTPPPAFRSEIGAASLRAARAARNGMVSTVCAKIAEPLRNTRATAHFDIVTPFCPLRLSLQRTDAEHPRNKYRGRVAGFNTAGVVPGLRGRPDRPLRAAPLAGLH